MYGTNFKRKIRVLQFPLAASKGGITQYILNLWKNIDKDIIQFDFMTFNSKLDFEDELIDEGCKVHHISCYPEVDEKQFIEEFKDILSYNYDVIELHTGYWKNTIMEKLAKEQGVGRIIIHAHSTGIVSNLPIQKLAEEKDRHYKIRDTIDNTLADNFLACSYEAADWLYGNSISKEKIVVVKNTIDTNKFKYNVDIRKQIRRDLGLKEEYIIGHVGRLEKEKNHKFILDIFAKLHKHQPQAKLIFVGDGSCKELIEKQIKELQLEDCVIITGWKKNSADYLQAMDAFVFPSLFEGFGLALLEAQCSGLRCIGSTNIPDAVFITENAMQISLDEPEKWVDNLEIISKGYDRYSQDMVLKEHGFDTITQIERLEKIYMGQ